MKFKISISILLSTFLFSCTSRTNPFGSNNFESEGDKLQYVRLDLINDSASIIPLSSFFDEVKIIPLETKSECLIGRNYNYIITDEYILISSNNGMAPARIFQFDQEGRFIREFGKAGKGPGEHQSYMVDDITWYPQERQVLVSFLGSIVERYLYNEEGKLIQEIQLPWLMGREVHRISDDLYLTPGRITGVPFSKKVLFNCLSQIKWRLDIWTSPQ